MDAAAYSLRRNLRVNTKYALALAKEWHLCHLDEPLTDVSSDTFCEGLPYEATADCPYKTDTFFFTIRRRPART